MLIHLFVQTGHVLICSEIFEIDTSAVDRELRFPENDIMTNFGPQTTLRIPIFVRRDEVAARLSRNVTNAASRPLSVGFTLMPSGFRTLGSVQDTEPKAEAHVPKQLAKEDIHRRSVSRICKVRQEQYEKDSKLSDSLTLATSS